MWPIIVDFGIISIESLWVFAVVAFIVTLIFFLKNIQRARINPAPLVDHGAFIFFLALIFSRLFYFFTNLSRYTPGFTFADLRKIFFIWDGGLSLWGSIVGFLLAILYISRRHKQSVFVWYDALAIPMMYGLAIGNIGQFLSGHAYGRPTELPWGINFVGMNVKYTVPIHPTQIYSLIGIICILYLLKKLKEKHKDFFAIEGNLTLMVVLIYSVLKVFIEFFRGDDTLVIGFIRFPQFISLVLVVIGGYFLRKRVNSYKNTASADHKVIAQKEDAQ